MRKCERGRVYFFRAIQEIKKTLSLFFLSRTLALPVSFTAAHLGGLHLGRLEGLAGLVGLAGLGVDLLRKQEEEK